MKKFIVSLMALLVIVPAVSASLLDVNLTYASRYIFRGYDLNQSQPSFQPGVTINNLGLEGLTLNATAYYNVGTTTVQLLNELDYTLAYSGTLNEAYDYSVTYAAYTYAPSAGLAYSRELSLGLTAKQLPFKPTLTYSYDHIAANASFWTLALGQSLPWYFPLDVSLVVDYDGGQFGSPNGISDCTVGCKTSVPWGIFTIEPSVNYVFENKSLRGLDNLFWFSCGLSTGLL